MSSPQPDPRPSTPAQPSRTASVLAVLASAGAALLGRVLGWAFGLQFALPLFAGLLVLAFFRKRARPEQARYGMALALLTAELALAFIGYLLALVQHEIPVTGMAVAQYAIHVGLLTWLYYRPSPPPALVLLVVNAYYLFNVGRSLLSALTHHWFGAYLVEEGAAALLLVSGSALLLRAVLNDSQKTT